MKLMILLIGILALFVAVETRPKYINGGTLQVKKEHRPKGAVVTITSETVPQCSYGLIILYPNC